MRFALHVVWICFLSFLLCSVLLTSVTAQENKESTAPWVVEIEPGIKRYGKVSKYSKVGHANSFDVSPDGETIAFASGTIQFWDIEKGKVRDRIDDARAQIIEYSADGLRLYAASYGGSDDAVVVYNGITGEKEFGFQFEMGEDSESFVQEINMVETDEEGNTKVVTKKTFQFNPQGIAVSQDDDRVAVHDGNNIVLFDALNGEQLARVKAKQYIRKLVFIDDGRKFVDTNGNIYSSDDATSEGKLPRRVFSQWMQALLVNPKNSNQLAGSSWNRGVVLYDLEDKEKTELETESNASQFMALAFSGNGKLLAGAVYSMNNMMGSRSRPTVYVWDVETGKIQNKFEPTGGQIAFLRFSATGDLLYSKSHNQIGLTEWDLNEKQSKSTAAGHTSPIYHLKFCPGDESILTASYQGSGIFFDLESGEPGKRISTESTSHLDRDREGRYYVSAANYNSLTIYDHEKDRSKNVNVRSFQRPSVVTRLSRLITRKNENQRWENFAINDVCVSEDNRHLYVACRGQWNLRYEKYELSSGKSVDRKKFEMEDYWESRKSEDGVNTVYSQLQWQPKTATISRDGRHFAVINDAQHVIIIDAENGDMIHDLGSIGGDYNSRLYFVGDGEKLIVIAKGKASVWNVKTGEQTGDDLQLGTGSGNPQFALNSDQTKLACVVRSDGLKVKVFDFDTMEESFSRKVDGIYNGIALSDSGTKVALAKNNGQFDVWDLDELDK